MVGKGALFSKLTASLIEVPDQQNIGWKNASCSDQRINHCQFNEAEHCEQLSIPVFRCLDLHLHYSNGGSVVCCAAPLKAAPSPPCPERSRGTVGSRGRRTVASAKWWQPPLPAEASAPTPAVRQHIRDDKLRR